jgi:transcriptional regulator with XRE-family HTH domain
MSIGYAFKTVRLNKKASRSRIGVKLGRLCICNDIAASTVAETMGVSRQTVYNWFAGITNPHKQHVEKILDLINSFKRK